MLHWFPLSNKDISAHSLISLRLSICCCCCFWSSLANEITFHLAKPLHQSACAKHTWSDPLKNRHTLIHTGHKTRPNRAKIVRTFQWLQVDQIPQKYKKIMSVRKGQQIYNICGHCLCVSTISEWVRNEKGKVQILKYSAELSFNFFAALCVEVFVRNKKIKAVFFLS